MALAITVTKKSVDRVEGAVYRITANLTCTDGATTVINEDFSTTYSGNT